MKENEEKAGIDSAFTSSKLVLDYKSLLENTGIAIVIIAIDGKYIFANTIAANNMGCDVQGVVGKMMSDFLPPEVAQKYLVRNRQLIQSGKGEVYEATFDLPSGTKTFLINDQVLKDDQGNGFAIQSSSIDITERKVTEKRLAESEANARGIMESTDDVLVLLDKNGILIDCNEAHARRLNKTREELLGKCIFDELPPDLAKSRRDAVDLCVSTGECVHGEDSRFGRCIEYVVDPIFSENRTVEKVAIFARDVTERKRTEEELLKSKHLYEDLVSKITVGVYVLRTRPDESFGLEYVSPRMSELLGLSVDDLLSNHEAIFKVIHPEDLDSFIQMNLRGIQHKVPFDWKGRIVVKGHVRWLHVSSLPQLLENGDTFWHGLVEDITERVRNEAEIKLKNAELTNLNATKDKFFSIIAHDLKSPFNSIIGFSSLLARQVNERDYEGIKKYATIIQESSQQALDLLVNLLEWSRSQTGKMVFTPEDVDVAFLISQSVGVLIGAAQQKQIAVHKQMPANLVVRADNAMVNTILRNLISNAIKFTNPGGSIVISAERKAEELLISVADNGVGINQVSIDKLFRIEETYSTLGTQKEKGSGLGLLLCKEFVEKHGGRIWVESEVGKGSTFLFTIPLKKEM